MHIDYIALKREAYLQWKAYGAKRNRMNTRNCLTKHRGGVVISGPWSILVANKLQG